MDLLQLLTGSENLYKYLFLGGIGLLVLSLLYPLNKKYELSSRKDLCNKEISLLNVDIDQLSNKVVSLGNTSKNIKSTFDSLRQNNIPDNQTKQLLKDSFNKQLDYILERRYDISKKQVEINYIRNKITTLQNHIDEFEGYQKLFYYPGIIFSIIGIIGWYLLMKKAK